MGGAYQTTYVADKEIALHWWKSLSGDYSIHCIGSHNELLKPDEFTDLDPRKGVLWKVAATQHPTSEVTVCAWLPNERCPLNWRIDILYAKGKHKGLEASLTTALAVEHTLANLGARRKESGSSG